MNKSTDRGLYYDCKVCGREYFISWQENSCQCAGCVSGLCPECEVKRKELEDKCER